MKNCSRKTCARINPQPDDNFGRNKRLKSGLKSECRHCRKAESAAWSKTEGYKKARVKAQIREKPYLIFKARGCANCEFIAVDRCQLDVDHIDGNHNNNDPSNLQTLCANCHRLKTKQARDGAYSPQHMKAAV